MPVPAYRLLQLSVLTGLLAFGLAAEASVRLAVSPGADSLRFAAPDVLYANGLAPDFSNLQITDEQGRRVDYAACVRQNSAESRLKVAVLGVPDAARAVLDGSDQLTLQFPPGAKSTVNTREWVLDLRATNDPVAALYGLPPVSDIRSSPNLQQWSAPLNFTQDAEQLRFAALRARFFRLRLEAPAPAPKQPVIALLEPRTGQRVPRWFSPQALDGGVFGNTRKHPIFAARVMGADLERGWTLQSRQGDWDAWKPRGRTAPGATDGTLAFSAVTDPQWRLQDTDAAGLELAHAEHELRLRQLMPDRTLLLSLRPDGRFGPSLSCRGTESLPPTDPSDIRVLDDFAPASDGPSNLRLRFLIALLGLALVGGLTRIVLKRRRKG